MKITMIMAALALGASSTSALTTGRAPALGRGDHNTAPTSWKPQPPLAPVGPAVAPLEPRQEEVRAMAKRAAPAPGQRKTRPNRIHGGSKKVVKPGSVDKEAATEAIADKDGAVPPEQPTPEPAEAVVADSVGKREPAALTGLPKLDTSNLQREKGTRLTQEDIKFLLSSGLSRETRPRRRPATTSGEVVDRRRAIGLDPALASKLATKPGAAALKAALAEKVKTTKQKKKVTSKRPI